MEIVLNYYLNYKNYFGVKGRIGRLTLWGFILAYIVIFAVVGGIAYLLLSSATIVAFILYGLAVLFVFISGICTTARRLHDRNKSGWWYAVFYILPNALITFTEEIVVPDMILFALIGVAIILSIWGIVEIGFLKGTTGDNQYGEDPLPILPQE